jgi:cystathionine beta-lyase
MNKVDFDTMVDRYGTYSTQWDYVQDRFGQANLLPFTISDMDFKAPQGVNDLIANVAQRGLFGYTRWNNPDFKEAIASWFKKRYKTVIDEQWIVYSPAVIFSLAKLLEQFSRPGDRVVTLSPCYDAFINTITANQRNLIEIDINRGVDFDQLEQTFKTEHPAVFVLCNPHNPLGVAWSHTDLDTIISLCNAYHVAIISDEIHLDVIRQGVETHSLAQFFNDLIVPCAVITSASKAFNIPTLGCSYALIPDDRQRLEFMYMLKQKNALSSVPYLGMLATIQCYQHEESWLNQLNHYIDSNFSYMASFLEEQLGLHYPVPQATYLAWLDTKPLGIPMPLLQEEMVTHQKVAIMDGRVYGNGGKGYLRLNLGAPRPKIEEGLRRFAAAVKVLQGGNN